MSIKKSIALVVVILVMVTAFQLMTNGGNTMLVDMSDTAISFSGIDEFRHEVAYEDIASVTLEDVPDWDVWGGHEFGYFRIGHMEDYVLFVTTQCNHVVIAELTDGSRMVFNYNNTNGTEEIYRMLLANLSK